MLHYDSPPIQSRFFRFQRGLKMPGAGRSRKKKLVRARHVSKQDSCSDTEQPQLHKNNPGDSARPLPSPTPEEPGGETFPEAAEGAEEPVSEAREEEATVEGDVQEAVEEALTCEAVKCSAEDLPFVCDSVLVTESSFSSAGSTSVTSVTSAPSSSSSTGNSGNGNGNGSVVAVSTSADELSCTSISSSANTVVHVPSPPIEPKIVIAEAEENQDRSQPSQLHASTLSSVALKAFSWWRLAKTQQAANKDLSEDPKEQPHEEEMGDQGEVNSVQKPEDTPELHLTGNGNPKWRLAAASRAAQLQETKKAFLAGTPLPQPIKTGNGSIVNSEQQNVLRPETMVPPPGPWNNEDVNEYQDKSPVSPNSQALSSASLHVDLGKVVGVLRARGVPLARPELDDEEEDKHDYDEPPIEQEHEMEDQASNHHVPLMPTSRDSHSPANDLEQMGYAGNNYQHQHLHPHHNQYNRGLSPASVTGSGGSCTACHAALKSPSDDTLDLMGDPIMYATFVAPVHQYSTETEPSRQPSFNYQSRQPSFKQNSSEAETVGSQGEGSGQPYAPFPERPMPVSDQTGDQDEVQDIYAKVPLPPLPPQLMGSSSDCMEISQEELDRQAAQERLSFISGSSNNVSEAEGDEDPANSSSATTQVSSLPLLPPPPPSKPSHLQFLQHAKRPFQQTLSPTSPPYMPATPALIHEGSLDQWGSGEESDKDKKSASGTVRRKNKRERNRTSANNSNPVSPTAVNKNLNGAGVVDEPSRIAQARKSRDPASSSVERGKVIGQPKGNNPCMRHRSKSRSKSRSPGREIDRPVETINVPGQPATSSAAAIVIVHHHSSRPCSHAASRVGSRGASPDNLSESSVSFHENEMYQQQPGHPYNAHHQHQRPPVPNLMGSSQPPMARPVPPNDPRILAMYANKDSVRESWVSSGSDHHGSSGGMVSLRGSQSHLVSSGTPHHHIKQQHMVYTTANRSQSAQGHPQAAPVQYHTPHHQPQGATHRHLQRPGVLYQQTPPPPELPFQQASASVSTLPRRSRSPQDHSSRSASGTLGRQHQHGGRSSSSREGSSSRGGLQHHGGSSIALQYSRRSTTPAEGKRKRRTASVSNLNMRIILFILEF